MSAIVGWMESIFVWLGSEFPWVLSGWIVVVLPTLIFRRTRALGAKTLLYSSYYTGFSCWWFCFILCYRALGGFWLLFGLIFMGVGVVPLAFVGLMVKSFWTLASDHGAGGVRRHHAFYRAKMDRAMGS